MAPRRSERRAAGEVRGRANLAQAPIGTETQILCPEGCGLHLVVGEGRKGSKLEGLAALRCQRLGCNHQEALPALMEMAALGAEGLPGLEVENGERVGADDAVSAAEGAPSPSEAPAAPTAAGAGSGSDGFARNTPSRKRPKAERLRRLNELAGEGATAPEDPAFGAPAVEPDERAEGDAVHHLAVADPAGGDPIDVRVYGSPAMPVEVLDLVGRAAEAAAAQYWGEASAPASDGPSPPDVRMLAVEEIAPHALNPRKRFDEDALGELTESIKAGRPATCRRACRAGGS
jgi:hypothetical protein